MAKGTQLGMAQTVSVFNWISERKDFLEDEGSNYSMLSKQATAELGFKVSTGIIKKALNEAGIEIRMRKGGGSNAEKLIDLCVELVNNGDFNEEFLEDLKTDPETPQRVKDALAE